MSVTWELRSFFTPEVAVVPVQNLIVRLLLAPPWERLLSVSEVQRLLSVSEVQRLLSVSEVQSSVAIAGCLPLASVKVECVSLTGGQVRGQLDSDVSEFVPQVPVVQYSHLVPPFAELDHERTGSVAPLLWISDAESTVDVLALPAWRCREFIENINNWLLPANVALPSLEFSESMN